MEKSGVVFELQVQIQRSTWLHVDTEVISWLQQMFLLMLCSQGSRKNEENI